MILLAKIFFQVFCQNDKICSVHFIKFNSHFVQTQQNTPTRYLISSKNIMQLRNGSTLNETWLTTR